MVSNVYLLNLNSTPKCVKLYNYISHEKNESHAIMSNYFHKLHWIHWIHGGGHLLHGLSIPMMPSTHEEATATTNPAFLLPNDKKSPVSPTLKMGAPAGTWMQTKSLDDWMVGWAMQLFGIIGTHTLKKNKTMRVWTSIQTFEVLLPCSVLSSQSSRFNQANPQNLYHLQSSPKTVLL